MNATEQKILERIEFNKGGLVLNDIDWLIAQLKAAQEELTTAKALLASHETGDAMLLELLPGHATIAEGIQALKEEIAALKSDDALATAYACGMKAAQQTIAQRGHVIRYVGEGQLAVCDRCKGGEVELETPCAERLAATLAQKDGEIQRIREAWQPLYYAIGKLSRKLDVADECNCGLCEDAANFIQALPSTPTSEVVPWEVVEKYLSFTIPDIHNTKRALEYEAALEKLQFYAPKGK